MRKLKLDELGRVDVPTFKSTKKTPITVVLDNIRSAMNVGSFFRTSDAFLIERIILCGITATPPNRDIRKTAIGATDSVDWEYHQNVKDVVTDLKSQNYNILAIEQTSDSIPLTQFEPEKSNAYAVIFGNEVNGVSEELLPLLDEALEIPQYGTKHSLNVSVCGGIVLHYLATKMGC